MALHARIRSLYVPIKLSLAAVLAPDVLSLAVLLKLISVGMYNQSLRCFSRENIHLVHLVHLVHLTTPTQDPAFWLKLGFSG